jgi:hypothetical protein
METDAPTPMPTVYSGPVYEYTPEDFHGAYYHIFRSGNRNAASHKWFNWLHIYAENPAFEFDFVHLNKYYCPISGSPTSGARLAKITLPRLGSGEPQEGAFSYCCWPCFCDLMDFAYVDTVTVADESYNAIVIGDPCANEAVRTASGHLDVAYQDPFRDDTANLKDVAPELQCECPSSGCRLSNATLSDGGYPVIGLFFAPEEGSDFDVAEECQSRADTGYQSGMGLIFREAAGVNPIMTS